jgi:hypothetical protein
MAAFFSGTGVPPVNHPQDARATFKLHHYKTIGHKAEFVVSCLLIWK